MIITILELPIAIMFMLTGQKSKLLLRLIVSTNNFRHYLLDKFASIDDIVDWEQYDGKEDRYTFLTKQYIKTCLILVVGTICVFAFLLSLSILGSIY